MIVRLKGKDHRLLVYHVDQNDQLVFVNSHWDDFFREQKLPGLGRSNLQGKRFWDLVPSPEVKVLFQETVKCVRASNREAHVRFRYDSATYKRFFHLRILPLGNGSIEFSNSVSKKISRFATSTPENLQLHVGLNHRPCGWCNRALDHNGHWSEVDHLQISEGCFPLSEIPPFVSKICPECVRSFSSVLVEKSEPVMAS